MLEGHTDDIGDSQYNLELSRNRAEAARAYLIKRFTLPSDTIQATGLGESKPIVENRDSRSRKINRRVELSVVQ